MSWWTYVNGMVVVHVPGRTQAEIEYILKSVLDHLPKVTGSEENMGAYINKVNGYNSSSNCDEFHNFSNLGKKRGMGFETQSTYLLTLYGTLRNRMFEQTLYEMNKWLNRLGSRLRIEKCLVEVKGYDQKFVFCNQHNYLGNLFNYEKDVQWYDYLRWDPLRDEEGNLLSGKPETFTQKVYPLTIKCNDGFSGKEMIFQYESIRDFFYKMKDKREKLKPLNSDKNFVVIFFNSEETTKKFNTLQDVMNYCKENFNVN